MSLRQAYMAGFLLWGTALAAAYPLGEAVFQTVFLVASVLTVLVIRTLSREE